MTFGPQGSSGPQPSAGSTDSALLLADHPHRRYNPLTGEWVLVSPHRAKRPWQGQTESPAVEERPSYDQDCYLCPGNTRANGECNPAYETTYVFDNDFPALLPDGAEGEVGDGALFIARAERGCCRVLCFSPRHDLTLAEMSAEQIAGVIDVWAEETTRLGSLPYIGHVQLFENKGKMMGCSNPHPHGQIWATESLPNEPAKELATQQEYFERHRRKLLADYLEAELRQDERIVVSNDAAVALVPFWAVWPFETMVLPTRPVAFLSELSAAERRGLAEILQAVTIRYDNVFQTSFPYSMGWHQAPTDGGDHPQHYLHAHFYPPLLRSATVKKFMVGFEMLANPQRDITPETSAANLRDMPEVHFRQTAG